MIWELFKSRTVVAGSAASIAILLGASAVHAEVQVWTSRDAQQGGVAIVAQRQGFFEKAGVDAKVKFVSSGSEIPAGMAGGTIQVAIAGWTNPMAMVANGLPVKILAETADSSAAFQIVVRSGSGIASAKDLDKKRLGLTRIPLVMPILMRACAASGCDVERITLVNMLPEDIVLAFQRGNVDAVLTWEPWATYARKQNGELLLSAADKVSIAGGSSEQIDGLYVALFARTDFLNSNPEPAKSIISALANAAEWMNVNPDAAAELISKEINIPVDVVKETLGRVKTKLSMTTEWSDSFDRKAEYLLKAKELPRKVTAKDAFLSGPLSQVCQKCVSLKAGGQ
jgi:ABC-type nitrate/sulfonate/bicarbonate transport system substrate-binding protein